jgi:hypothetical protein
MSNQVKAYLEEYVSLLEMQQLGALDRAADRDEVARQEAANEAADIAIRISQVQLLLQQPVLTA